MDSRITRRSLIGGGLAVAGAAYAPAAGAAPAMARLRLRPERVLNRLPAAYNGFSIEQATLEDPDIYRAGNRSLVALFRRLTPNGVLRIGGNSSEFCWWKPDAARSQP